MTARAADSGLGIVWMVSSTVLFVGMDACIKHLSRDVHPFVIALYRNIFGFAFLLPVLIRYRFEPLRGSRWSLIALRAAVGFAATLSYFYALKVVPFIELNTISLLMPLLATILSVRILRVTSSGYVWAMLVLGFIGALIIVRPGALSVGWGTLLAFTAVLLNAAIFVIVKILSRSESSLTLSSWMCISLALLSLPTALPVWTWPSAQQIAWLAAIGILATSAQYAIAQACRYGEDIGVMMPAAFLRLVWALLVGVCIFGERIDGWSLLGAGIILIANIGIGVMRNDGRATVASDAVSI